MTVTDSAFPNPFSLVCASLCCCTLACGALVDLHLDENGDRVAVVNGLAGCVNCKGYIQLLPRVHHPHVAGKAWCPGIEFGVIDMPSELPKVCRRDSLPPSSALSDEFTAMMRIPVAVNIRFSVLG